MVWLAKLRRGDGSTCLFLSSAAQHKFEGIRFHYIGMYNISIVIEERLKISSATAKTFSLSPVFPKIIAFNRCSFTSSSGLNYFFLYEMFLRPLKGPRFKTSNVSSAVQV